MKFLLLALLSSNAMAGDLVKAVPILNLITSIDFKKMERQEPVLKEGEKVELWGLHSAPVNCDVLRKAYNPYSGDRHHYSYDVKCPNGNDYRTLRYQDLVNNEVYKEDYLKRNNGKIPDEPKMVKSPYNLGDKVPYYHNEFDKVFKCEIVDIQYGGGEYVSDILYQLTCPNVEHASYASVNDIKSAKKIKAKGYANGGFEKDSFNAEVKAHNKREAKKVSIIKKMFSK